MQKKSTLLGISALIATGLALLGIILAPNLTAIYIIMFVLATGFLLSGLLLFELELKKSSVETRKDLRTVKNLWEEFFLLNDQIKNDLNTFNNLQSQQNQKLKRIKDLLLEGLKILEKKHGPLNSEASENTPSTPTPEEKRLSELSKKLHYYMDNSPEFPSDNATNEEIRASTITHKKHHLACLNLYEEVIQGTELAILKDFQKIENSEWFEDYIATEKLKSSLTDTGTRAKLFAREGKKRISK